MLAFLLSTGEGIWYNSSQLCKPANQVFKLHAMVNSHAYEEHCGGMYDVITNLSANLLQLETGFITLTFAEEKKEHLRKLCTTLGSQGSKLRFQYSA